MAQQTINHGSVAGDGTGESPFSGMQKVNANFTELYAAKDAQAAALAAKAPLDNPTFTGTVNGITKAMVGLGNVDNVSDANKPVSTAQNTAIVAGDNLRLKAGDMYGDFVVSGLATPVPSNILDGTLSIGIAYIGGTRVEKSAPDTYTYQATRDTYVDLSNAGVITRIPVVNGAAEPAVTANSLRLEKVVTDATKISSVIRIALDGILTVGKRDISGKFLGVLDPVSKSVSINPARSVVYDTRTAPNDLNWLDLRSPNEWVDLTISSPYSPGHILHPSLCDVKDTFNGYRYWMVYTPYPDSLSQFENPCIAASNDLRNWVYPALNPIVPHPGSSNYNSDTDLYFDAANSRLVILYREVLGSVSNLRIVTSLNGSTWSAPTTIYSSTANGTPTSTDIATPSIWFDDILNKWVIIGLNAKDNGSAWPVVKITSSNLLSGWDTSATWTVLTATPPVGRKWWNFQFRRLSNGSIIGIAQDNAGTTGSSGKLFALYSLDGSTFAYKLLDTQATKEWYRATFIVLQDFTSGKMSIRVIGSKLTEARLFDQIMQLDSSQFALDRAGSTSAILSGASIGNIKGVLHADTFNRADDVTGLGTSTSGHTYTQVSVAPTVIGILSNQAYPVNTAGNNQAYRNIGSTDCILKYTITEKTSGEAYLLARFIDNSNKIRIGISGSSQLLFQVVTGGAVVVSDVLGITPIVGDEVMVSIIGNQFLIFLNGKFIAKRISNQGLTSTNFGLAMSGTAIKVDNFIIIDVN